LEPLRQASKKENGQRFKVVRVRCPRCDKS
jgi:hypothetical protein